MPVEAEGMYEEEATGGETAGTSIGIGIAVVVSEEGEGRDGKEEVVSADEDEDVGREACDSLSEGCCTGPNEAREDEAWGVVTGRG